MKKMSMVCMVVIYLAMQGFSSTPQYPLETYVDWYPDEMAARLREDVKDKAKLRLCMARIASSPLSTATPERVEAFKQKYGVSDEAMLTELLDIIREGAVKAGWTKYREGDAKDTYVSVKGHLRNAIFWLNLLSGADAEIKPLMMDIATDGAVADEYRSAAIHTYLRRANVQEKWNAIARFLADDVRPGILPIFNVYHAAMQAYDEAEGDTQKRETIVTMMSAALMKEEDKKAFAEADKLLAERNKEYAESPQRKAVLERINKPPEKPAP